MTLRRSGASYRDGVSTHRGALSRKRAEALAVLTEEQQAAEFWTCCYIWPKPGPRADGSQFVVANTSGCIDLTVEVAQDCHVERSRLRE
jgi:hypothetical protein